MLSSFGYFGIALEILTIQFQCRSKGQTTLGKFNVIRSLLPRISDIIFETFLSDCFQSCFETLANFLAANENPRVVSVISMAIKVRYVGISPSRLLDSVIFHGFALFSIKTV